MTARQPQPKMQRFASAAQNGKSLNAPYSYKSELILKIR
jgi:hypothetical protein